MVVSEPPENFLSFVNERLVGVFLLKLEATNGNLGITNGELISKFVFSAIFNECRFDEIELHVDVSES